MVRIPRASSKTASRRISSQYKQENADEITKNTRRNVKRKKAKNETENEYTENDKIDEKTSNASPSPPRAKRRKTAGQATSASKKDLFLRLFLADGVQSASPDACHPPQRRHTTDYHRPLLLDGAKGQMARQALLTWYDSNSNVRGMPWRKPWLDPASTDRETLAVRAYEVWISEIMAQQTRIPVVVEYWTRWVARWPTVAALAAAAPSDVTAAWSGLGYYSRASRLHAAAQGLVAAPDLHGILPADTATLKARVPGVGRYTAGAISAMVFGRAAAMVDGNVMRVLSRQMGLYADSSVDRSMTELLWAAAEALVRVVAWGDEKWPSALSNTDPPASDRPGRWGQALMELGSTVCTPKPDCAECPIRQTCRAYAEGVLLEDEASGEAKGSLPDLEDSCQLCEPFIPTPKEITKRGAFKTSTFFETSGNSDHERLETIISHARLFPLRRPKKAARMLETLVCAVRTTDNRYLLQRRPKHGLLAGLWQLPSHDLSESQSIKQAKHQKEVTAIMQRWWEGEGKKMPRLTAVSLGSIPWLFSHIRQKQHVFLFQVPVDANSDLPTPEACCWVTPEDVETGDVFTMGTGMRRCWDLVREHIKGN